MSADEKVIEEGAKTIRHYLDPILKAPLEEYGLFLKDKISFWRFKNQVNTALKAREFLEKKGVRLEDMRGKIKEETIIPLLEASSETGDPLLSSMFASLLAGAMSPESYEIIHPSYGKVLNQVSGLDAFLLNELNKGVLQTNADLRRGNKPEGYREDQPLHRQFAYEEKDVAQFMRRPLEQVHLSFQNLKRLGLCDEGFYTLSRVNAEPKISFTDFGMEFITRCTENVR